jgi:NAD(P)H-flavin reductase
MKAVSGPIPPAAQKGLKQAWREQKYFLPCICQVDKDIEVTLPDEQMAPHIKAEVLSRENLNNQILRLRLRCQQPFEYQAGQFIHLQNNEDKALIRSYSLASVPSLDDALEIHVQHVPDGRMSGWIHRECQPGQELLLSGPYGECYYMPGFEDQGLLLLATGSGLAPLWGVLRDALEQGHKGPVRLFHGCREPGDLYLVEELQTLAEEFEQFAYFPCLDGDDPDAVAVTETGGFYAGRVQDEALKHQPDLKGWRVYLCGNPAMVNEAKRKAFLAGAALAQIHADPFVSPFSG